jgi:hypothetical protein
VVVRAARDEVEATLVGEQDNPLFDPETVANTISIDWDTVAERDVEWRQRWDREVKGAMS